MNWEAIMEAIFRLEDEEEINRETAGEAAAWVDHLRSLGFPPSKIFSHGGDAVTFVWEAPAGKLYLTPTSRTDAATFWKE